MPSSTLRYRANGARGSDSARRIARWGEENSPAKYPGDLPHAGRYSVFPRNLARGHTDAREPRAKTLCGWPFRRAWPNGSRHGRNGDRRYSSLLELSPRGHIRWGQRPSFSSLACQRHSAVSVWTITSVFSFVPVHVRCYRKLLW